MRRLAMLLFVLVATPAFAFTGNQLKTWMANDEAMDRRTPGANGYAAGLFTGYVSGVADTVQGKCWCLRPHITQGQIFEIVKKYLNDHPELLHLWASDIVESALREALPCNK